MGGRTKELLQIVVIVGIFVLAIGKGIIEVEILELGVEIFEVEGG